MTPQQGRISAQPNYIYAAAGIDRLLCVFTISSVHVGVSHRFPATTE
jgi:hypothetical protein